MIACLKPLLEIFKKHLSRKLVVKNLRFFTRWAAIHELRWVGEKHILIYHFKLAFIAKKAIEKNFYF